MFAENRCKDDIRYKGALLLMSTAEEVVYLNGTNKPATMIMVRRRFPIFSSILYDAKGRTASKATRVLIGRGCLVAREPSFERQSERYATTCDMT